MPPKFLLISAPAKVNLYLGVHPGRDEEGYHRVDTVMTSIDLTDTIAIAPSDRLMVKTVPEADFPEEDNTAYRAAVAMGEAFGREPDFAIVIDKHIPIKAGLGGPSTDAAATIMGLCQLWGIDPSDPSIDKIARSIGADVPFFLYGPPAHLDGRGDRMREMFRPLTGTPIVLVKPMTGGVTAAAAYARFDADPQPLPPIGPILEGMRAHREVDIFANVANNLAPAALAENPMIGDILAWLRDQDDVRAAEVSGSGSCCFAVCNTAMAAEKIALAAAKGRGWWSQTARMEKSGPYVSVG